MYDACCTNDLSLKYKYIQKLSNDAYSYRHHSTDDVIHNGCCRHPVSDRRCPRSTDRRRPMTSHPEVEMSRLHTGNSSSEYYDHQYSDEDEDDDDGQVSLESGDSPRIERRAICRHCRLPIRQQASPISTLSPIRHSPNGLQSTTRRFRSSSCIRETEPSDSATDKDATQVFLFI